MYLNSSLKASVFTIELTILNLFVPLLVIVIMVCIAFKFSGSPLRSTLYSDKLKYLQIAVMLWTIARILRGIGGLYESKLFYGMILGLSN